MTWYLVQQCILPQTEYHHKAAISCSKRCEEVLSGLKKQNKEQSMGFKENGILTKPEEIKFMTIK